MLQSAEAIFLPSVSFEQLTNCGIDRCFLENKEADLSQHAQQLALLTMDDKTQALMQNLGN